MDNKYLQFKAGGRRGYPEYNGSVITKRDVHSVGNKIQLQQSTGLTSCALFLECAGHGVVV